MSEELVVLVDDVNNEIGMAPKRTIHHASTPLHRGFSCYVFNKGGEFLLTQRALSKKTFPGIWTNSCCGHPAPGESIEDAVRRRLQDELGLISPKLILVLPHFRYRAEMNGIVENELCPVYVAIVDQEPNLNPDEVEAYEWVSWDDFVERLSQTPKVFSSWSREQVEELEKNQDFRHLRTGG